MQRKQRAIQVAVMANATRRSTRGIVSGEGGEKLSCERLLEFCHRRNDVPEELADGGDGPAQAAGVDQVEQREVRREVERNAMERDAAFDADAQGADLR